MTRHLRALLALGLIAAPVSAEASDPQRVETIRGVSAAQLFDLAERAEREGNPATAETIYKGLEQDPNLDTRNEARFRHGQLLVRQRKLADAATLYRAILDEKPDAQRIRLELAGVLQRMGDLGGARRAIRQAQAGQLPPDVARVVDQYAAALRSLKRFNASVEVSLAPSNNINRATSATTLDTILAPFQLSDDARAHSGVGIKLGGQASARLPLNRKLNLTARVSALASLYRDSSFDDWQGSAEAGVEAALGRARLRPLIGRSYRYYGTRLYATSDSASLAIDRPIGRRAQLDAKLGTASADYRLNDLQDGRIYNASLTYERALTERAGGSIGISFERQGARDPGYATKAGAIEFLAWRDTGRMTLYATGSVSRLVADARLTLFPERRKEWQYRTVLGATLRQFTVANFAPVVRVSYERNQSTVGIYDYRRLGAEIGISRAF